jgi:UDP-N-acetylglucosamine--N-acetylmuramyl-(pentapeptide) pyrophosphoryl-undecaprenol N-acetylglucosamine transferase
VTFAGSPDRVEARLVPEAGFEFDAFRVVGFPRRPGLALARALLRAVGSVRESAQIIESRQPSVVLGGGGYVAGPVVVAAARRRIPAALMEADAHLGLANRLAAPFARRVFLAFPIAGRDEPKYRVTGRPIPAQSKPRDHSESRRRFGFRDDERVLLVFGGSQGALALNEFAVDRLGAAGPSILHLAGERDYDRLRHRVSRDGYRLLAFVDDFGAALSAADLVLARAGGSVWEIAAAGKPAILVPYPHATADHQTQNARFFEQAGGARVIPEAELGKVPELVTQLLGDPERLERMGAAMRRVARPDAAEEIAEEVSALAATRR